MEKIDVLMADITAIKNTVAAMLPLIPDRALLVQRMDAGALAIDAALVSSAVSEEFLAAVQDKLQALRQLVV